MSLNGSVHGCMSSSRLSEVPTILYQEKVVEAWVGSMEICFSDISRCLNDDKQTMGKLAKRNQYHWDTGRISSWYHNLECI